jgi:mRNA-degrading endonuclease RelE of RelBE toxin-antitoxin system
MAYNREIVFTETPIFTKQIINLLSDDEYLGLQQALIFNPSAGDVIRNSGGLRKVRWRTASKGKRGGIRVIYYWLVSENEIYLLLAYGKTQKDDLSARELGILRGLVSKVVT